MLEHLPKRVSVAIVGAGFSGLGMAIRLKREGQDDFVVLEKGDDVGGTWWWNTYPGCRCDTPSRLYSFSFTLNPNWRETYARQPEIQQYLRDCAEREQVIPHIHFGTTLNGAEWDDARGHWVLHTSKGELHATSIVLATGALSEPRIPAFPGLDTFEGMQFHSARWNHDYDLKGKRVAVLGTGASAVQIVPAIAPMVKQLDVYQRSAAWVPPHTGRATVAWERALLRAAPVLQKVPRAGVYYQRELLVLGWTRWRRSTVVLEALCRAHLRRQVRDPEVQRKLMPDYRLGCKRPCPSNTFYPTFNRDNVELITDGIREFRPQSIVAADGIERPVDAVVFATGFHVTDSPLANLLRGRHGKTLGDVWNQSPQAYLGTTVKGFPNAYILLGPNTGNLTTSVVLMIESQMHYVLSCLRTMRERSLVSLEVAAEAQEAHTAHVRAKSKGSVWLTGGCESWYLDARGENSTLWPDFAWRFDALTQKFQPQHHIMTARTAKEGQRLRQRPVTIAGVGTRALELWGDDDDRAPFVFVHGLTDCADFWRPTMDLLAHAGRRAIAVDLPGFGEASPLADAAVLPQLDRFLDALVAETSRRAGRPVIVVGHSLGACAALRLAQRRPRGLAGVVAAPPTGFDAPELSALHVLGRLPVVQASLRRVRHLPSPLRRRLIAEVWKGVALGDREAATAEFVATYVGFVERNFDRYVRTSIRVLGEFASAYDVEKIVVPVLLVWGTRDRIANPKSANRLRAAIRDARLEPFEGVGHCPAIEATKQFTATVLDFAAELEDERATMDRASIAS